MVSTLKKITCTLSAITYNKNQGCNPWQNPWIRIKELDRGPFALILDWILAWVTLTIRINLLSFPDPAKSLQKV